MSTMHPNPSTARDPGALGARAKAFLAAYLAAMRRRRRPNELLMHSANAT